MVERWRGERGGGRATEEERVVSKVVYKKSAN